MFALVMVPQVPPFRKEMDVGEAETATVSISKLLNQSWFLFRTRLWTFVCLMGFLAGGAMCLSVIVMYFFLVPKLPGVSLRDVWIGMSVIRKTGIFLLYLANVAMINRALAASTFVVGESQGGREITGMRALGLVRRKHLRLYWLIVLAGLFSIGPLFVVGLPIAFFLAPALPVAALENLGVVSAVRRSMALSKGGRGRIAVLFVLYLALVVGSAFVFFGLLAAMPGQLFAHALIRIPASAMALLIILLIPQFYIIALTLNYFDQRVRKGESYAVPATPGSITTGQLPR